MVINRLEKWRPHWPHWENHCEHPTDSFVGTIRDTTEHEVVDVYVYKQPNMHKVCLRYGEEGQQYLSPHGDVGTFLYNAECEADYLTDTYRLAAELIRSRCDFEVNIKTVVYTQMED